MKRNYLQTGCQITVPKISVNADVIGDVEGAHPIDTCVAIRCKTILPAASIEAFNTVRVGFSCGRGEQLDVGKRFKEVCLELIKG